MQYLRALDPEAAAFTFRSFAETPGAEANPRRHPAVALDKVPALIEKCAAERRGLFVVVNKGGDTDASTERVRAVFADFDAKDYLPERGAWDAASPAQRANALSACQSAAQAAHDGTPLGSAIVRSGGGYHVYWFVEGVPVEQFKPLQQALARRFGSDPAVCNPSRIMRLPGSLHWKSGTGLAVELLQCSREARYTAADLVEGLGLVVEPGAAYECRASTADPGTDPVLAYLLSDGRAWLKPGGRTTSSAPIDVVCPNADAHSLPDSLTSTVYMPQGLHGKARGFHCSHGHCTGVRLADFLRHVGYEADCATPLGTDAGALCEFAKWLAAKGHHVAWVDGAWLCWDGARYKPDVVAVRALVADFARDTFADASKVYAADVDSPRLKARFKAATGLLQQNRQKSVLQAAEVEFAVDAAALDTRHGELCVPNGAVRLCDGVLLPPNPADGHTMRAGVAFDPAATCHRWDRFLAEVFDGNAEVIAYIQRLAGYWLTGYVREECVAVWYGAGSNGKSVLMTILAEVFGEYAVTADPALLTSKSREGGAASPELMRLRNKRLCYLNETKQGDRLNDAEVRRLASPEKIEGRELYKGKVEFTPTAKLCVRTNDRPVVVDATNATWRRLHFLPFTQQFTGTRKDTRLLDTLRAELPGVLAWAVRGAVEWHRTGLCPPPLVLRATEEYREESDPFAAWVAERVERVEGKHHWFTSNADLLTDYTQHQRLRNPPTTDMLGRMMKARGFMAGKHRGVRGFQVRLKIDEELA